MPTVRDVMAKEVTVLSPSEDVMRAMRIMIEREISGAPVVDEHGNLVGLLTQRDCLTVAFQSGYYGEAWGPVSQYMSTEVDTVPPTLTLVEIIERFYHSPHRRFPVVEDGRLVGQISRRDVLRAVLDVV